MFAALQLVFQILLTVVAVFLILLVLVQRGRGGGLAGALGGMGGSSAFGAKAGDIFTRITVVAAAVWIILCITVAKVGPSNAGGRLKTGNEAPVTTGPEMNPPAEGETAVTPESGETAAPATETPATDAAGDGNEPE